MGASASTSSGILFRRPISVKELQVRETKDRVIALDGHQEVAAHKKKTQGDPPAVAALPIAAPQTPVGEAGGGGQAPSPG